MAAPTILVVDDEPLVRWSVAETLGDYGYRVTAVADAAEAMRVMAGPGKPPDVVLLDLWLPDRNDLEVLSAMQAAVAEDEDHPDHGVRQRRAVRRRAPAGRVRVVRQAR